MKRSGLRVVFGLALVCLLNACASHNDVASDQPTRSAASVPGERVSGEGMTPGAGPGGASANVHW